MPAPSAPSAPSLVTVYGYLCDLASAQFYGNVTLRFDKGRIVLVISNQAIKPENLPQASAGESKPRNNNDQFSPSS